MPIIGEVIKDLYGEAAGPGSHPRQDPRLQLAAVYIDPEYASVVVYWYGRGEGIPVSPESAQRVLAQAEQDQTVESSEGYEDDPTATIYHLLPNTYVSLLSADEQRAILLFRQGVYTQMTRHELRRSPITGRFKRRG